MLAPERQARILKELQLHEAVRVADIAATLNVSEMTVRRDIEALDHSGLARKIHGGAMRPARLSALEPGFLLNVDRQLEGKRAIAVQALSLIQPGMTLALTGGTTTYQLAVGLAGELEQLRGLTVVTNSLKAAELLYRQQGSSDLKVIVTGGERTPSEALVGPVARMALGRLNTDICFMGVHGLDAGRGLTSPNLLEAETNAAFVEATTRLVILADSTKFQVRSLASIASLDAVDTIITDDSLGPAIVELFSSRVPNFITAPASGTTPATSATNSTRKIS